MIYIRGYPRGDLSFVIDLPLSSEDILILLGFGFISAGEAQSQREIEAIALLSQKPFETLIVVGPDESNIRRYPLIERYGGPVCKLGTNIYALVDGYRYEIDGISFFVLGGGFMYANPANADELFPARSPSLDVYLTAFSTLFDRLHFDYILTVSAPPVMAKKAIGHSISSDLNLPRFLDWMYLNPKITFKRWFSGGFRSDSTWNDVTFLYQSMFIIPPNEEVQ